MTVPFLAMMTVPGENPPSLTFTFALLGGPPPPPGGLPVPPPGGLPVPLLLVGVVGVSPPPPHDARANARTSGATDARRADRCCLIGDSQGLWANPLTSPRVRWVTSGPALPYWTTTVPAMMPGCSVHWYEKLPVLLKVRANVSPLALFPLFASENVTLCGPAVQFQVTVPVRRIVTLAGEKALFDTVTVAASVGSGSSPSLVHAVSATTTIKDDTRRTRANILM